MSSSAIVDVWVCERLPSVGMRTTFKVYASEIADHV
jgi:hypothetical protein